MAGAGRILGEQDVAGADDEVLALARLEIERPAECDDELPRWRIMPGKGPPDFVSWKEMLAAPTLPLNRSPRAPSVSSIEPSSNRNCHRRRSISARIVSSWVSFEV